MNYLPWFWLACTLTIGDQHVQKRQWLSHEKECREMAAYSEALDWRAMNAKIGATERCECVRSPINVSDETAMAIYEHDLTRSFLSGLGDRK